jgi:hypothetical protein
LHFRRLFTVLPLAAGAALATAAPASASPTTSAVYLYPGYRCGPDTPTWTQTYDGGAAACFYPTGEKLLVCDTNADGHHPAVWYKINDGSWDNKHYDLGAGNCAMLDLSIAETGYITYYTGNYEGDVPLSYSPYMKASAAG